MKRALYDFLVFSVIFFIAMGFAGDFSLGLLWVTLLGGAVFAGVGLFWRWVRRKVGGRGKS